MGMGDQNGMTLDYPDAHHRHWEDAELLREQNRLANADHLYGLSAECGLKALMQLFGMGISNNLPTKREDREHIDKLLDRYEIYRDGYSNGPKFSLPWQFHDIPFANWHISDRYTSRDHFRPDRLEKHYLGAKDVKDLVARAKKQGVLP